MRVHIDQPGRLRHLLEGLGVPGEQVGEAIKQVRATNPAELTRGGAVRPGTTLEIPDAVFPDGFVVRQPGEEVVATVDASLASGGAGGAQQMGALGTHGLKAPGASRGPAPKGPLDALSLFNLPLQAIDGGRLRVEMPLKAGTWKIQTPDGQLEVGVKPGGRLAVDVEIGSGPNGPVLKAGQVRLLPPLIVENAGDLVKGIPFAGLATRLARPQIEALTIGKDGSLAPRFGAFGMKGLGVPLADLVLPQIETDVSRLLEGSLFRSGGLMSQSALKSAAADRMARLDLGALLGSLGAMSDTGTFSLNLHGHAGRIDVRGDEVTLGRDGGPFSLSLGGEVGADRRGAIRAVMDAQLKGGAGQVAAKVNVDAKAVGQRVEGSVSADVEAAPADGRGRLSLTLDDEQTGIDTGKLSAEVTKDGVAFRAGGATAKLLRDAAGKAWLNLDDMQMQLQGRVLASAELGFSLEKDHLVVSDGKVHGRVDLDGGARAEKGLYGVQVAPGASLSFEAAAEAELKDGTLHLEADEARVAVHDLQVTKGLVKAPVEEGEIAVASGALDIGADGAEGHAQVDIDVRARPKLGFIPSPMKGGARGRVKVALKDGQLHLDDQLKIGVR